MNRVPSEILANIIESLDEEPLQALCCPSPLDTDPLLANLRNVRLVCKGFKVAAATIFGNTYFRSREVVLEQQSLEKLLAVAKKKEFRNRVVDLTVNTFQLPTEPTQWSVFRKRFAEEVRDPHPTFLSTKNSRGRLPYAGTAILKAHAAYKHLHANQKRGKATGAYTGMLAEILEYLKKSRRFRSLVVSGHDSTPSLRYITRKIGLDGILWCDEMGQLISEATAMVFQAVSWSRVKLCTFTLLRGGEENLLLPSRAFKHLKSENHLHNLRLELKPNVIDEDGFSSVSELIQACPKVAHLEICFPGFINYSLDDADMFFGTQPLKYLKDLRLCNFSLPAQELANILYRHRATLKRIEIEGMILSKGRWSSIFKFLHDHFTLSDFCGHNLYEPGMRYYHRPQGDLLKYILNQVKEIDWYEVNKDYSPYEKLPEGLDSLLTTFGMISAIYFEPAPNFFNLPADADIIEPPDLEVKKNRAVGETDSEDWSTDEDGVIGQIGDDHHIDHANLDFDSDSDGSSHDDSSEDIDDEDEGGSLSSDDDDILAYLVDPN